MQINDLLGANEIVRLKGKVTHGGEIQSIMLTNKNIYFHRENEGEWSTEKYDDIIRLGIDYYSNQWRIILHIAALGNPDFIFCQNRELAEQVFRCIKQCWDESRTR